MKVGLEIHVQLDTHKLFCECPSTLRLDESDFKIKRKLHAVSGEMGKVDNAAIAETKKNLSFVYHAYDNSTCLVELDCEPPHKMNESALKIALETSLLLNMKPIDEIQIMRKTVVDGSNTSGFQRTALISENGFIETEEGKVRISSIAIEEDSARKIKEENDEIHYNLDRLGIPLIEIRTEPDITSAEQAKKAAKKIGLLTRATGKMKRGIGTIRQDVNVSIPEGKRVEIKGAQDLKSMPLLIENEVKRQEILVSIKKELEKRKFTGFNPEIIDVTHIFSNTQCNFLKGKTILGIKVPQFNGIFGLKINENKTFGKEIAEYTKSKGLLHSDELPKYGIVEEEKKKVIEKLGCSQIDAFVLMAVNDFEEMKKVIDRINKSLDGVPKEVRKANLDSTTSFLRTMPGEARMYPETDVPPILVEAKLINEIKKSLPEKPEEKLERYIKLGLNSELASQLANSEISFEFDKLKLKKENSPLIASILLGYKNELKKRYNLKEVAESIVISAVNQYIKGNISKEAIYELIAEAVKENKKIDKIAEKYKKVDISEVEKEIIKIIKNNKDKNFKVIMGILMKKYKGRINGKILSDMIKKQGNFQ